MKRKKIFASLFIFVISVFTLLSSIDVNAATKTGRYYETWMEIGDYTLFTSQQRLFYAGRNVLQISFDEWNSSICTSINDQSYVTINLIEYNSNRNMGSKTLVTKLGTCSQAVFGTIPAGNYNYYFSTFDTNQTKYCGYRSDYIVMRSDEV